MKLDKKIQRDIRRLQWRHPGDTIAVIAAGVPELRYGNGPAFLGNGPTPYEAIRNAIAKVDNPSGLVAVVQKTSWLGRLIKPELMEQADLDSLKEQGISQIKYIGEDGLSLTFTL